jgi:hypothetical protein
MDAVEILVHNLSHSDLILKLSSSAGSREGRNEVGNSGTSTSSHGESSNTSSKEPEAVIARPKFSAFKPISKAIYSHIYSVGGSNGGGGGSSSGGGGTPGASPPTAAAASAAAAASSSSDTVSASVQIDYRQPYNRITRTHGNVNVPVGFDLSRCPIEVSDKSGLRFRNEDDALWLAQQQLDVPAAIEAAYFPLIAVLIPKWLQAINNDSSDCSSDSKSAAAAGAKKLVVVLVSGRGQPISGAKVSDNSTQYTAKLMKMFLNHCYPQLTVQLLHSKTNLFR